MRVSRGLVVSPTKFFATWVYFCVVPETSVAEQELNLSDIDAVFEQVGTEAVPEHMSSGIISTTGTVVFDSSHQLRSITEKIQQY